MKTSEYNRIYGKHAIKDTFGTLIYARTFFTKKLIRDGLYQSSRDLLSILLKSLMERSLKYYSYQEEDTAWQGLDIMQEV